MCEIDALSLNLELILLVKLAGQWVHEAHLSPMVKVQLFMWMLVPETQVLTKPSLHPCGLLCVFFCLLWIMLLESN